MKAVLSSYTLSVPCLFRSAVDGRSIRNSSGLSRPPLASSPWVVSLRRFEQHSPSGRLPHSARVRRSHDGARGPAHHGSNIRQIGTYPRHELRGHPRSDRPMLGPIAGGLIVGYFHWRVIFFYQPADWSCLACIWSYRHLPDHRKKHSRRLDVIGLILFGFGIALLSYVLEVFGEHTLKRTRHIGVVGVPAISLTAYGLRHARSFLCFG